MLCFCLYTLKFIRCDDDELHTLILRDLNFVDDAVVSFFIYICKYIYQITSFRMTEKNCAQKKEVTKLKISRMMMAMMRNIDVEFFCHCLLLHYRYVDT